MEKSENRIVYADILRIVAVFLVVLIHVSAPFFTQNEPGTSGFAAGWIPDALGHAGVPLFVMLSGMFLLDDKREITFRKAAVRYALPMVILYVIWCVLYALANRVAEPVLLQHAAVNGDLLAGFVSGALEGAYHLWYLPLIAVLYLLTPILRRIMKNKTALTVFAIAGGVALFLPTVLAILAPETARFFAHPAATAVDTLLGNLRFCLALGYPLYFVLGYMIAHAPRPRGLLRAIVYVWGTVGLAEMLIGTAGGDKLGFEPLTVWCAVYSVAVFCLFSWKLRDKTVSPRAAAVIAKLSKLTFGVYLIHVEIIALVGAFLPAGGNPWVTVIAEWLGVTAVSFLLSWVIALIPGVKKLIRM